MKQFVKQHLDVEVSVSSAYKVNEKCYVVELKRFEYKVDMLKNKVRQIGNFIEFI